MRWILVLLSAAVGLMLCSPPLASGDDGEAYRIGQGAYEVHQVDVVVRDEARGKDLELRVRMSVAQDETEDAARALVLFSHGAGGSNAAFGDLQELWASHGYVTIAMTHADSIELRWRRDGEVPPNLRSREGLSQLRRSVDLAGRVRDCTFVLDALDLIRDAVVDASGRGFEIDPERIAIAGHSAGAMTTQLCIGVRARGAGIGKRGLRLTSIGDDRFRAGIIISGQGTTSRLLTQSSWEGVQVPMFVITGSLDVTPGGRGRETAESRQHPYTLSKSRTDGGAGNSLLFIEGATHSSYQGEGVIELLGEEPETDSGLIRDAVGTGTLVFLNAHVRGDEEALRELRSDRLAETIPGKVRYEFK